MNKATVRQNIAAISCSLAATMTGTAFVWFAPLMLKLTSKESPVPMTTSQSSWIVASIEFGEIVSVIPAGIYADKWGRRNVALIAGPLCVLSFVLKATTTSIAVLFVVRFLQGLALGIAYTVCPIYIAEIAEPRIRGVLSCHFQTLWYTGTLFAYAIGPYVSYTAYAYISLTIPIVFMVTFYTMPETPYYLLMKGMYKEARESLVWLRDSQHIDNELKSIDDTIKREDHSKGSWNELFATKKDRKAFLIVQIVCLTKYMNGTTAIETYSSQTYGEAASQYLGHDELTILLGVLLIVITFASSFLSDSIGRRPLLIFSCFVSGIFLLILAGYYYCEFETSLVLDKYVWILYIALAGFCVAANVGISPLMQTIKAEFFTSRTRGLGGALTEVLAAVGVFVCVKQYQLVQDIAGVYLNFVIYSSVCIGGAIALYLCLPETAGKTLGEIQGDMEKGDEAEKAQPNE